MKIDNVLITELRVAERNSRTHSAQQIEQIAASIQEFGFTNPVLIDEQRNIIAGHGRTKAAEKLGSACVPCVVLTGLTGVQKRAYLIADNQLPLNAEWDIESLQREITALTELDFNIEVLGFDDSFLDELILESAITEEVDAVPELTEEAVTVLGDVWQCGEHRVMCGDSTVVTDVDKLMGGEKADMVFTDPPYGVDYDGGTKIRDKLINDNNINMYDLPIKNAFNFSKDNASIYLWFADKFVTKVIDGLVSAGYQMRTMIIWNKDVAQFGALGAQYKMKHEPCIHAFKKGKTPNWIGPNNEVSVWDISRDHKSDYHPTQKPTDLSCRAMGNHSVRLCLDLFGGSGSTLIACETTNRTCYTMELSPGYVDVIVKRWQNLTGKNATLASDNKSFDEHATK